METNYNVDYFIKKFEAIPEHLWRVLNVGRDGERRCAMGHCGLEYEAINQLEESFDEEKFKEAASLGRLFSIITGISTPYKAVYTVNDDSDVSYSKYKQPTAKQRILAALYDIKKLNSEQGVQECDATKSIKEQELETKRKNIQKDLAILPIEETSDVKKLVVNEI